MEKVQINKNNIVLCELHYDKIHGKTSTSSPDIDGHYLLIERFDYDTELWNYDKHINLLDDIHTNNENIPITSTKQKIADSIYLYNYMYNNLSNKTTFSKISHNTIRNYKQIIKNPTYIKPEIGTVIYLPIGDECVVILKTFWIRLVQRRWKTIYKRRMCIIQERSKINNLQYMEINGKYPDNCVYLPSIKGMLKI